jgi:serine phosphatase RsbU (regulator of sigma subunit)
MIKHFLVFFVLFVFSNFESYSLKNYSRNKTSLNPIEMDFFNQEQSETYTLEKYKAEVEVLEEKMQALQGMLEMTTAHLIAHEKEIEEKNFELEVLNKELKDGLSYGKYVQDALYRHQDKLASTIFDTFIYFKQRDSVGGDLPYYNKIGDTLFIAVIDCTGHGVAGAILTGLANSYLNDLLQRYPHNMLKVAEKLNDKFFHIFGETGPNFGMDLGLVSMDETKLEINFVGCGRPLLFIRNGEALRYPKSGPGIGNTPNSKYALETIQFQKGDHFYLYSDGITDQLGDLLPKRITEKRLSELLVAGSNLNMVEQKELIINFISDWKGKMDQTDDQLIIGIEII